MLSVFSRLPGGWYLFLWKPFTTHTCPKDIFTVSTLSQFFKRIYTCIWTCTMPLETQVRAQRWLLALTMVIFAILCRVPRLVNLFQFTVRLNPKPSWVVLKTSSRPKSKTHSLHRGLLHNWQCCVSQNLDLLSNNDLPPHLYPCLGSRFHLCSLKFPPDWETAERQFIK